MRHDGELRSRRDAAIDQTMSETTATSLKIGDLANPTRFLAFAGRLVPWLGGIAAWAARSTVLWQ